MPNEIFKNYANILKGKQSTNFPVPDVVLQGKQNVSSSVLASNCFVPPKTYGSYSIRKDSEVFAENFNDFWVISKLFVFYNWTRIFTTLMLVLRLKFIVIRVEDKL